MQEVLFGDNSPQSLMTSLRTAKQSTSFVS